jgi:hypothetical protein
METRSQRHAIAARDAAAVRLRRLTTALLVAATGIAGVVAGEAERSTHGRSVASRTPSTAVAAASIPPVPAPAATTPVAAFSEGASAAPASPPASPPTSSPAPPVVVSGGS